MHLHLHFHSKYCSENENGIPSFNTKTINKINTNNYTDKCGELVTSKPTINNVYTIHKQQ